MRRLRGEERSGPAEELSEFRGEFHACLTRRGDALFEPPDALLCADGPVKTLVGLSLVPQHRRGHGALYDAVNQGRIDTGRLRDAPARLPLPRAADGRIVLAVDVSPWLRPDADTSQGRSFCHTHGRGEGKHQMVPGWPYSIVAALEPGRSSWTVVWTPCGWGRARMSPRRPPSRSVRSSSGWSPPGRGGRMIWTSWPF